LLKIKIEVHEKNITSESKRSLWSNHAKG